MTIMLSVALVILLLFGILTVFMLDAIHKELRKLENRLEKVDQRTASMSGDIDKLVYRSTMKDFSELIMNYRQARKLLRETEEETTPEGEGE